MTQGLLLIAIIAIAINLLVAIVAIVRQRRNGGWLLVCLLAGTSGAAMIAMAGAYTGNTIFAEVAILFTGLALVVTAAWSTVTPRAGTEVNA